MEKQSLITELQNDIKEMKKQPMANAKAIERLVNKIETFKIIKD